MTRKTHLRTSSRVARALSASLLAVLLASPIALRGEGLFATPRVIESKPDSIHIAADLAAGVEARRQAWTFAAPAGEFQQKLASITIRDTDTHEVLVVTAGASLDAMQALPEFRKAFVLRDLGVMRRVRLMAAVVDPSQELSHDNRHWTVRGFDLGLSFSQRSRGKLNDSAFTEPSSPMRRLLDAAVCNPEMIDAYGQQRPAARMRSSFTPSDWQPKPQHSRDFPWMKIPVDRDGLYAIDARWLEENGVDPMSVAPESLILMSRGKEVACVRTGSDSASFREGARLLFFGCENTGPESRERAYFLGRRPERARPARPLANNRAVKTDQTLDRLRTTHRIEEDKSLEARMGNFLSVREMTWVWKELAPGAPHSFAFALDDVPDPAPAARARLAFYQAGTGLATAVPLEISINGRKVAEGSTIQPQQGTVEFEVPAGVLRADGGNTLEMTMHIPVNYGQRQPPPVFLDALELEYDGLLRAKGGALAIAIGKDVLKTPANLEVGGLRGQRALAFDISDPARPMQIKAEPAASSVTIAVHPDRTSKVLVVEDDMVPRAPKARASVWKDLRRDDQGADVVIVYHRDFAAAVDVLTADLERSGLTVTIADVESLYEAYTNGDLSPAAIQLYLRDAVDRWKGRKPAYAILVGDCTSDGRGVARNDVRDFVPTWIVPRGTGTTADDYACDAYFSWVSGDDELADLFVGRLSVNNADDAREVVRKITAYRNQPAAEWNTRLLGIADPGEYIAASTEVMDTALAPWVERETIATGSFPWEDNFYLPRALQEGDDVKVAPRATVAIENAIEQGAGIVTFFGHGSPNIWSNQRVWFGGDSANSDNLRLTNRDRLPFLAAFTCNNGAIAYPLPRWNVCISEDMMRVRDGGAIAALVPSGPGFPERHQRMAEGLFRAWSVLGLGEFGVLSEAARLHYQATEGFDDHSRMFLLLGDPTLKLATPGRDLKLTVPEEIPSEWAEQRPLHVMLDSNDAITSAVLTVRDDRGTIVGTQAWVGGPAKEVALDLVAQLSDRSESCTLNAAAMTESGAFLRAGQTMRRAWGGVLITRARQDGDAIAIDVENSRDVERAATIEFFRADSGSSVTLASESVSLAPGESRTIRVRPGTGDPGLSVVDVRVAAASRGELRPSLPSAHARMPFAIPSESTSPEIVVAGAFPRLLPGRKAGAPAIMEVIVANIGATTPETVLEWTVVAAGGERQTGSKSIGVLEPGQSTVVPVPLRMGVGDTISMRAFFADVSAGSPADASPADNSRTFILDASRLADLRIVPGSLRHTPENPTEGTTIFVEGVVENAGAHSSFATDAALFAATDKERGTPLFSFAGQPDAAIPALAPGESWPFRVRWDPFNNPGTVSLQVAMDASRLIVESDEANNIATVDVRVKSKWNLAARGMRVAPGDRPGFVTLFARVANTGETDAQRVVVTIYGDQDQTKESLLGEVLVERLPAGQLTEVPFAWNVQGLDPEAPRQPSFSIGLKGSLQRISSVTD